MLRFNMPKLRIYQQILICFGLIVSLPLLGVTFIINDVNQRALRRELARFSEHTAEALYRDFGTEMSWQKQQGQMMSRLMQSNLKSGKHFEEVAKQIAALDPDLDAVGIYDRQGHLLDSYYRDFRDLSPELRLPEDLPRQSPKAVEEEKSAPASLNFLRGLGNANKPASLSRPDSHSNIVFQPFSVLYFNTGNPLESPYFLRAAIPFGGGDKIPGTVRSGMAAYYVQQKHFPYLRNLVRADNNSLYDAFYIIDSEGIIIAGPQGAVGQERISPKDYEQFRKIKPGVTHEFSSSSQADYDDSHHEKGVSPHPTGLMSERESRKLLDNDDPPPLKKVIVKMPEINWGIIIESPYHVKRKYIQQAAINTFLLSLACLILMILLVLPYLYGISRNFRQLLKGVKAMGEGNYFRRIRLITNFFTPYEIVYLTLEFNRMARKTADSWQAIQQANQKLAQMDEFKSGLIDTVSHELRTPLTSIKGYTSRLLRYDSTLDSETRRKSLKIVKQQADRLSRLVEDLLVIPDLEKANLRVFPDRVELMPVLEGAIQVTQNRYTGEAEREIRIVSSAECPIGLSVLADPDRLEQILINLIDNAMKYSLPQTPIEVLIQIASDSDLPRESALQNPSKIFNGKAVIEVVNQCEPLPLESQEALNSLFEKFKRLDDSLVRTTRGSGLGLFITRGLVEAMGGSVQLLSKQNRFTARFDIPLHQESLSLHPN